MRRPDVVASGALAVGAFAWYDAFSLHQLSRHRSGYDLALFDQAIGNLAHLRAPVSDLKGPGFNLFGDHFHPIIAVVAPFYRLYPHVGTLLTAQAVAIALSVFIVAWTAVTFLSRTTGLAIGAGYALSWGVASALAFDFHEVSFGMPLLAGALSAYLRRRWWLGHACTLALLTVKEDMAFTVAALGIYVFLRGRRWEGAGIVAAAGVWFGVVVGLVIPALSPFGRYVYWSSSPALPGQTSSTGLHLDVFTHAGTKVHTVVLLLLVTGFLALLSPLTLLALPTLAWRFAGSNPNYWGTDYHYSAILMPIVFIALVDGLVRLRERVRPPRWQRVRVDAAIAVVAIAAALVPSYPFGDAASGPFWRTCSRCAAAAAAVRQVPDGATVLTDDRLSTRLVDRARVYLVRPGLVDGLGHPVRTAYVVIDERHADAYGTPGWLPVVVALLGADGYVSTFRAEGYVVYRR